MINKIVKALDSYKKDIGCAKCGFKDKYLFTVIENALDLINHLHSKLIKEQNKNSKLRNERNRLQAENSNLQKDLTSLQAENESLKDILYDVEGVNLVNYWYQQCKIAENGYRNFAEEINRLQAENLSQKIMIKRFEASVSDYKKTYIEQKSEIERLKPFEDKIAEFNSHIQVEDMLVFASSLEEWLEFCENLKAEAYKECIKKMKTEIERALENNYEVRAERIEKHNVGDSTDFISYCEGKIDCLRGLDDFLDNLLKGLVGEDSE